MRIKLKAANWLLPRLQRATEMKRQPDFIIGNNYCLRWWVIPRNRWFNIYFHKFLHSDDDRALHDHPWWNVSFLLRGRYVEHLDPEEWVQEHIPHFRRLGMTRMCMRKPGDLVPRWASTPHRVQLLTTECYSLFITGPVIRKWGFHCPQGWRYWLDFVAPSDKGQIGKGCED